MRTLSIELSSGGTVAIEMFPAVAPRHVARICDLAQGGCYDGVAFHRVIEGFMAQTGDVKFGNVKNNFDSTKAGTGGSSLINLPPEWMIKHGEGIEFGKGREHLIMQHPQQGYFITLKHLKGSVSMARSESFDSANSQFFICLEDSPSLNNKYTIFGQVTEGMEHVEGIKKGVDAGGRVSDPDYMVKVTVNEDNHENK
jgi:cyclophilin family peptidyl-prolyl cis-trans isomerase